MSGFPICAYCRERHDPARGFSFDGMGINGCDMYRSRIATLMPQARKDGVGPMLAAAPAMLGLLREILDLDTDEDGDVIIGADEDGENELMARIKAAIEAVKAEG